MIEIKEMREETEMDKLVDEMTTHICDELCRHSRDAESQEELDQICAECKMGGYVCGILNTYNELNDFEKAQCISLMEKYSGIVLCDECRYHAVEKSTGIHHCRLGGGLIGALKSGDGCSRGKLRGDSIDRE